MKKMKVSDIRLYGEEITDYEVREVTGSEGSDRIYYKEYNGNVYFVVLISLIGSVPFEESDLIPVFYGWIDLNGIRVLNLADGRNPILDSREKQGQHEHPEFYRFPNIINELLNLESKYEI